ncbi:MAG: hypothetical protein M1820_004451 [Bogoriella megaspora]|nr:MAG: hypothetical protein M1820_004451 [Bogoriella megaspora]
MAGKKASTSSGTRQKAFAPKVKTGCITCRIRRIKCDEGKPNCQRCESTGRKCDGYTRQPQDPPSTAAAAGWSGTALMLPGRSQQSPSVLTTGISEQIPMSVEENRSLEYFRIRTIPQLSGFFDSRFWNHYILQTINHQPAIRHAAIALGALHERFEAEDPLILRSNQDKLEGGFALQQYVAAIGKLVDPVFKQGQQALDVALTACILFTCFETLRGHHGSAMGHIASGINMLRELSSEAASNTDKPVTFFISSAPHVPHNTLRILFSRFDSQSIQMGICTGDYTIAQPENTEPGFHEHIPSVFNSLTEARNSMDYHERQVNFFFHTLGYDGYENEEALASRREHINKFASWITALDAFVQQQQGQGNTSWTERDIQAMKLLRVRHATYASMLAVTDLSNEMQWDASLPWFTHIIDLASEIAESTKNDFTLNGKLVPLFSLENGFTAALFQVARKCRDPSIRRRAIALMRSQPRQDGVWDGTLASRVAERLVQIEEDGLNVQRCEDVPREVRVLDLDLEFDMQGKKATLIYSKGRGMNEDPSSHIVDVVTW